jgi:hypothetical protein
VGIFDWLKRRGSNRDDEAAEREEYGGADLGEAELERDRSLPSAAAGAAAQVAGDDLADEERPRPYGGN